MCDPDWDTDMEDWDSDSLLSRVLQYASCVYFLGIFAAFLLMMGGEGTCEDYAPEYVCVAAEQGYVTF